jgi:hypothetical protein
MRPELARDPSGPTAVVWHITATKVVEMLCGAELPTTATASRWRDFPERPCPSCQQAYRKLRRRTGHREGGPEGVKPAEQAHPTG